MNSIAMMLVLLLAELAVALVTTDLTKCWCPEDSRKIGKFYIYCVGDTEIAFL